MYSIVWHGASKNISPYNIVQHLYKLMQYKRRRRRQGYVELLQIMDGPKERKGEAFVVHLFLYYEGSSYFVYDKLEYATVGYNHCLGNKFVRSRDKFLPGCKSWNHIGHNLPWFYDEAKAEDAEMPQEE